MEESCGGSREGLPLLHLPVKRKLHDPQLSVERTRARRKRVT